MLNFAVRASPTIKNMEGQHKLVGPQRPSTHGQLFASLPITRNLIFSDRRIRSRFPRGWAFHIVPPRQTTRHQKSGADPVEWADGSAGARATRNIAIPPHSNWNEWLRWPGTHGGLPRNRNAMASRRRSIGRRFCADCRSGGKPHLDCESVALAHRRRGEFGRKRLDTRGREVSRISDE